MQLSHELAQMIVDEYGAAVAVACHRKQDAPNNGVDHCHLLITMREVDETGIGPMIRRFNGIASSMSDDRVIVGKRALSGHMVWMRKTWAGLLGDATGVDYDWRTYKDQGLDLEPVKALFRSTIEGDRRRGGVLMAERAVDLAIRNAAFLHRAKARESRQRESPQASSLAAALIGTDARLTPFGSFNPIALLAIASSARDTVTEATCRSCKRPSRSMRWRVGRLALPGAKRPPKQTALQELFVAWILALAGSTASARWRFFRSHLSVGALGAKSTLTLSL